MSLLLAGYPVAGCAVDSTVDAKTTTETQSSAVTSVTSQTQRTEAIEVAAKRCSPLACCFPAGGGWEDDPFEDALRALGCTTPANYSEAAGTSAFWLYTRCSPSWKLAELVGAYSNVAPYDARFIDSVCLELSAFGAGQPDSVFVEFDPTCETCIANQD